MARHITKGGAKSKEIRAWGIRRRQIDINQLALAYYLLARIRIEEQRKTNGPTATGRETGTINEPATSHHPIERTNDEPGAA